MSLPGTETFSIGEVVTRLRPDYEITESNLRFWEKQGLLEPQRTPGGHRAYTAADVERIRLIKRLQADRHLPLSAIRKFCRIAGDHPEDAAFFIENVLRPQHYEPGFQPLTAAKLAEEVGLPLDVVVEMTANGLLMPTQAEGETEPLFDEDDRALCRMYVQWQGLGLNMDGLLARRALVDQYVRSEWEQLIRPNFRRFATMTSTQRMQLKRLAEEAENLLFSTARRRLREELWQSGELDQFACNPEET